MTTLRLASAAWLRRDAVACLRATPSPNWADIRLGRDDSPQAASCSSLWGANDDGCAGAPVTRLRARRELCSAHRAAREGLRRPARRAKRYAQAAALAARAEALTTQEATRRGEITTTPAADAAIRSSAPGASRLAPARIAVPARSSLLLPRRAGVAGRSTTRRAATLRERPRADARTPARSSELLCCARKRRTRLVVERRSWVRSPAHDSLSRWWRRAALMRPRA